MIPGISTVANVFGRNRDYQNSEAYRRAMADAKRSANVSIFSNL